VPAVLAGSGDDRGGLALSESTRTVDGSPSDVAGWTGVYVAARPARRCRPPRRSRPTIPGVRALSAPPTPVPG